MSEALFRPKSDLRHELKYLLRREQIEPLVAELRQTLQLDAHSGALGTYPITSLYYDTPDYKAYWDKLDGHRSRRKVRVRSNVVRERAHQFYLRAGYAIVKTSLVFEKSLSAESRSPTA